MKNYFIFVFRDEKAYKSILSQVNFEESVFIDGLSKEEVTISEVAQFDSVYTDIYMKNRDIDNLIKNRRLVLKENFDFFPMYGFLYDNIVSERLKEAIEQEGITGFEFTELDYEVIVDRE